MENPLFGRGFMIKLKMKGSFRLRKMSVKNRGWVDNFCGYPQELILKARRK